VDCPGNELRCLKKPQSMMFFVEVSAQLETARLSKGCISKERCRDLDE